MGSIRRNAGGIRSTFLIVFVALVALSCTPATQEGGAEISTSVSRPSETTPSPPPPTMTSTPPATLPPTALADTRVTVSGFVISGGDTTPEGLLDAPRRFEYQIERDDGSIITVAYRAYPPSPVGDRKAIILEFHAGGILIGDFLEARGSFDDVTKTLTVESEGDYIKTFETKP